MIGIPSCLIIFGNEIVHTVVIDFFNDLFKNWFTPHLCQFSIGCAFEMLHGTFGSVTHTRMNQGEHVLIYVNIM